jgi:hypothetical protein
VERGKRDEQEHRKAQARQCHQQAHDVAKARSLELRKHGVEKDGGSLRFYLFEEKLWWQKFSIHTMQQPCFCTEGDVWVLTTS